MPEVRFLTTIGPDHSIRLPEGISAPEGMVEVVINPAPEPVEYPPTSEAFARSIAETKAKLRAMAEEAEADPESMKATRDWLLGLAEEAEAIGVPLPADLAENHDHYGHGKIRL